MIGAVFVTVVSGAKKEWSASINVVLMAHERLISVVNIHVRNDFLIKIWAGVRPPTHHKYFKIKQHGC